MRLTLRKSIFRFCFLIINLLPICVWANSSVSASVVAPVIITDTSTPKVKSNLPSDTVPTTKRNFPFTVKFNKSVTGVSKNSFELITSPSIIAVISSFNKISDSIYTIWVTDQTTTSSYTGTIKLNIKNAAASTIKDSLNQTLDTSTLNIGKQALIAFPLTISINYYQPTPTAHAGGIVNIVGLNFSRVDKVLIGNVESKILFNDDYTMNVLVMPGSDTSNAKLKIIRGTDTVLSSSVYKVLQTNFPISPVNNFQTISTTNQKTYSNFEIEKNGSFAIVCNEFDSDTSGSCALFVNDFSRNLGPRVGWRQLGTKFFHPTGETNSFFGSSISIGSNMDHVAIGARNASSLKGEVILYTINRSKYYNNAPIDSVLVVDSIFSGNTVGEGFGNSTALSADGNTLLISAPNYHAGYGAVYAYAKSLYGWKQISIIGKPADAVGDSVLFGSSISLSADGSTAVIAASNDSSGKGAVWIFKYKDSTWVQLGNKLHASNLSATANFGSSIALSSNARKIIIGAPGQNNSKGATYYFKQVDSTYFQIGNSLTDTTSDNTSNFGATVTMSANGDLFAVSAPQNNNGAYFMYGLAQDSTELLFSNINKSADSTFGSKINLDYEGTNLLKEITYTTNRFKAIAATESLQTPIYVSSANNNICNKSSDTIFSKVYNAKSVNKVVFADTISLKFQAITDSSIAVVMDSTVKLAKRKIDFRYGIQHIFSDSILVDKIIPTVKIIFNKPKVFKDTVFQVKLRFSEPVSTDIVAHFPLLPSMIDSLPSSRLDSVKIDTAKLVFTGYYKVLRSGPIFLFNSNLGAFSDTSGNISMPINSDTIIFDNITIPPRNYSRNFVFDSLLIDYKFPEQMAPGTAKITFTKIPTDTTSPITWILSNTITSVIDFNVNPFADPTTFPFVTDVLPTGARLTYGSYKWKVSYQDYALNPVASSTDWLINIKGKKPLVYEYTPNINTKNNYLTLKGLNFSFVDSIKINNKKISYTLSSDSLIIIQNKAGVGSGYINFYYRGDSTSLDYNKISGAQNSTTKLVINKTWQKFKNYYKGKLKTINVELANTSNTLDNNLVLVVYKDSIATDSLIPAIKFNDSSIIAFSDTFKLLKNSILDTISFNFSNSSLILNDSTDYFFVIKQIDNAEDTSFKILAETNNSKSGAINRVNLQLFYEVLTKAYVFLDTISPVAHIVNQNLNRLVTDPFSIDVVFSEPVNDFSIHNPPLLSSLRGGALTASIDSVVIVVPHIWYREYLTPLQLGKIILFNVNDDNTRDLAGNPALAIGIDSVTYIPNNFKLGDYDYPYNLLGNKVIIHGNGFTYLTTITLNNQVISDSVLNDSVAMITLPNAATSGKLVLHNLLGDSTSNKLFSVSSTGTSQIKADASFTKFIPIQTGIIDSLQFYFTNNNSTNLNYFIEVFDHNGDKVYHRKIANSDTVQVIANASLKKINFPFADKKFIIFKDSIYYIKLSQITSTTIDPTILAGSNSIPKFNYAVNAYILFDTSRFNVAITNSAIAGIVDGQYYIDIKFNRPLRFVSLPLMLPAFDSLGNVLARIDSTVISNDGLTYREFVTPFHQGNVVTFNWFSGAGSDYFGWRTPPFGFDTVRFINTKKPIINSFDKTVVATGRIIQVSGKNLTNVKSVKVGDVDATFYVKNDDSLTFISPLNSGSGPIKFFNELNEQSNNIVDTFYASANNYTGPSYAWQKMILKKNGAFNKIGVYINNFSTKTLKYNLKLYNKDKNSSSVYSNEKFETSIAQSDELSILPGTNQIVYFNFSASKYVATKDSAYYFVISPLDNNDDGRIQIKFDGTGVLNGSAGNIKANILHTLELEPYLIIDTVKPLPLIYAFQNVTAGPFFVDLTFSEPVYDLSLNPIIISAGSDAQPKAILDSVSIIQNNLIYRYYYTPKTFGSIKFQIPYLGIAFDKAGNPSDTSNTININYIDTAFNNFIQSSGPLQFCAGDSVTLIATFDSTMYFFWNNGSHNRSIVVKESGTYFITMVVNGFTYYNTDTLIVVKKTIPIQPVISIIADSLSSNTSTGNLWYKNDTLLADTSVKIKSNKGSNYKLKTILNDCISSFSEVVSINNYTTKPIITGPLGFCVGDSVVLKVKYDTVSKYLWSNGATTPTIKVKNGGKYAVYIEFDSIHNIYSDTVNVVMNPIPIQPVISIIADSLSSNTSTGNLWYKNDTLLADTSVKIKSNKGSNYKLKTILNDCISSFSEVVSINNYTTKPIITGPLGFCVGDSVVLKVKYDTVSKYLWSNGATTPTIKVKNGGKYAVYIEFDSIHNIYSDTVNVVMNPIPILPVISRVKDTLKSSYLTGNHWYSNGTLLSDTLPLLKPANANFYSVKAIQNGCESAMSANYYFVLTNIFNLSDDEFIKINPNPILNKALVVFNIKEHSKINLEVYEINAAKKVLEKYNINSGEIINLENLSSGMYLFVFITNDGKLLYQTKILKL